MIYMLTGLVKQQGAQFIIIDVSGVGYGVAVPSEQLYSKDQTTSMYTYCHFSAEQGMSLYGFMTELERTAFTTIISCSGIGPKIGLALLASLSPEQFFQAITLSDHKTLSSIPGIGLKKAESIVMQLKDKVSKLSFTPAADKGTNLAAIKQVSEALQSLNYSRAEIVSSLDYVKEQGMQHEPFDSMLRKALSFLAKRI